MHALQSLQSISVIQLVQAASRRKKVYRARWDPFSLDNEDFRRQYRFSKSTVAGIIEIVKGDLQLSRKGCGTTPKLQILTAIKCWRRSEVQENAEDSHGLSQSTISRICARISDVLEERSDQLLKMPLPAKEQHLMREFINAFTG